MFTHPGNSEKEKGFASELCDFGCQLFQGLTLIIFTTLLLFGFLAGDPTRALTDWGPVALLIFSGFLTYSAYIFLTGCSEYRELKKSGEISNKRAVLDFWVQKFEYMMLQVTLATLILGGWWSLNLSGLSLYELSFSPATKAALIGSLFIAVGVLWESESRALKTYLAESSEVSSEEPAS